ncbi:MAG: hydrogenase maturation protease [Theionarchaea archaeon]|nr:hydrogenase maturation protease [Theionarchaea archaeon]MBU7000489.1 hydrogenase maturation protease [Theionarchaea archaeon]MBU7019985.1 hydrogenase maturation protease [Theionarchaea archaeon]MBU7035236.1 hydrogenase maturation protease [Theionarchaea archaeon]MBU7040555.1 hydrogenase maturation protease [Theionarchaea archaeon]
MNPEKDELHEAAAIAVITIGNELMGDDGAGPAVFEALRKEPLPPGVDVIDGGTGGMSLLHVIKDYPHVILVDCADFGGNPGEVKVFVPEEVRSLKEIEYSLHQLDLLEVIALSQRIGEAPRTIHIVAVQPERIEPATTLTRKVSAALPLMVKEVLKQIMKMTQ